MRIYQHTLERVVLLEASLFGEFEQLSLALPLQPRVRHVGRSDGFW